MEARTPVEILSYVSDIGIAKTQRRTFVVLIMAFFAGVFISFAAGGSTMAAFNLFADGDTYGLGRTLAGVLFGTGLILVIITGGELFTGNTLLIVPVLDRKITVRKMLLNWLLVYFGNFAGGLCIAFLMYETGLFNRSEGLLGGIVIKIAAGKTALPFHSALILGIFCNWLVCLAIWVSNGARDVAGKVLVIFPVIGLFVISGFEHSIANMYYIPAGILAKQNPQWLEMSKLAADQIAGLNWLSFFTKNLIPVTLGNIIGGMVLVGMAYWFTLRKKTL